LYAFGRVGLANSRSLPPAVLVERPARGSTTPSAFFARACSWATTWRFAPCFATG
jgi:hypothetical protein